MKISDILGFKYNGLEAIEAKLNGAVIWSKPSSEIEFSSCPFPRSWQAVDSADPKEYTSTNEYGTWKISCSKYSTTTQAVNKAFDGSDSTRFISSTLESSSSNASIIIECPVMIKPSEIYIKAMYAGSNSDVYGYNPETSSWENLLEFSEDSSSTGMQETITTENFYSKFRIRCYRYSSSHTAASLYEFQITKGTIKEA